MHFPFSVLWHLLKNLLKLLSWSTNHVGWKKVLLLSRVFQILTVGEAPAAASQTRKSQTAAWQQAGLPVNTVPGAVKRCVKCESVGGTWRTTAELSSGLYTHMHMYIGTCTHVHTQANTHMNVHIRCVEWAYPIQRSLLQFLSLVIRYTKLSQFFSLLLCLDSFIYIYTYTHIIKSSHFFLTFPSHSSFLSFGTILPNKSPPTALSRFVHDSLVITGVAPMNTNGKLSTREGATYQCLTTEDKKNLPPNELSVTPQGRVGTHELLFRPW